MSDFTETLTKIEAIKNTHERVDVSNFYVSNHLRENDCCIPSEDWEMILYYDFDPWCLIEDVTEHWTPELKRKVAKTWWEELKKINTDDKDFMNMIGFTNGDYLINTLKRNQEEKEMVKEKETTIYFADGTQADVYRHGRNEYSIYFDYTGSTVYGSYLDIAKAIEEYKEKMMNSIGQDDKENHPMTSVGTYINFWKM